MAVTAIVFDVGGTLVDETGAGMVALHIRRRPWGHLHEAPPEAIRISSLHDLPEAVVG